jgi:hypothetical protein
MTGSEFNKLYPSKMIKLTNELEIHNGYRFVTGLNIDTIKFDPTGSCKPGGIYFCELEKFPLWIEYSDTTCINFREVKIPDDAQIYTGKDKFKADKIILSDKQDIWNNEDCCKIAVAYDGHLLKNVKKQTEEICKIAVHENGVAILYVKDKTYDICKIAAKQNGTILPYVNQTEELCKLAVMQNGMALTYVLQQTEEICKLAVRKNKEAVQYVEYKYRKAFI